MAQSSDRLTANLPFARKQISVIDQPDPGFGGEILTLVNADGFASQKRRQPPCAVLG